jgi:omega-6 fatty acid desaturase (delta-12 desaturase)
MTATALLGPQREAARYSDAALGADPGAGPGILSAETDKQRVRRLAAHCAAYKGADPRLGIIQLANTSIPFLACIAAMLLGVHNDFWPVLLLALPAGGLLVRLFIIQHDCGHGSFLPWRGANDTIGRMISVVTLAPYAFWRRAHAYHHASSGHLGKRGVGDINTLTVREYAALRWHQRLAYRIYRHPLFLFGLGMPFYFVVIQRSPFWQPFAAREIWKSVLGLNAAMLVFYGALFWLIGAKTVLLVAIPVVIVASAIGGWLFYVQHQFEETHWADAPDWDFQVAAVLGSSYYDLPRPLQWFTGNIGLHHIHHLCSLIPNYKLQACIDTSPELQSLNRLTLLDSLRCTRLALWDEASRRLVSFGEARRTMPA